MFVGVALRGLPRTFRRVARVMSHHPGVADHLPPSADQIPSSGPGCWAKEGVGVRRLGGSLRTASRPIFLPSFAAERGRSPHATAAQIPNERPMVSPLPNPRARRALAWGKKRLRVGVETLVRRCCGIRRTVPPPRTVPQAVVAAARCPCYTKTMWWFIAIEYYYVLYYTIL